MEEYGVVLDFMHAGKSTDTRGEPVAQAIGDRFFTLLELIPKPGQLLTVGEKIYIGKGDRDKIDHIKGRITYDQLTSSARSELSTQVGNIVKEREVFFVEFFNKCGPVTIRLHQLELMPGIGKKHMQDILTQREKKPFESFADINQRVALLPSPIHIIVDRVKQELEDPNNKYYLLTRPPFREREVYR